MCLVDRPLERQARKTSNMLDSNGAVTFKKMNAETLFRFRVEQALNNEMSR